MPNPTAPAADRAAPVAVGRRGLLIDDRPGPREAAADALRRTLPQVYLEVAGSREEARPLIDRAARETAAGTPGAAYDFAVLRDGMAWGKDMKLAQFFQDRLPDVPQILTCDPAFDEAPPAAHDPAEAPRVAAKHGLHKTITIAGDDVSAVTAAAEACLTLGSPGGPDGGSPDETGETVGGTNDGVPPEDLLELLAAERRKVVALLRAAEQTAAREAAARRRLARVLHEDMLQTLVGARMFLSCARAVAGDAGDDGGAGGPHPLDEVDGLLLRSVQMCKDLTGLWSPLVLFEAGLVAALRWLGGDRDAAGAFGADLGAPGGVLGSLTPGAGGAAGEEPPAGDAAFDDHGPEDFGPIPAGLTVHVDCEDGAEPDTQDGRLLLYQDRRGTARQRRPARGRRTRRPSPSADAPPARTARASRPPKCWN